MGNLFRISAAALLSLTALGAAATGANAATCRDAHGRFERCPSALAKPVARTSHAAKTRTAAPARKVAVATTSLAPKTHNAPKHAVTTPTRQAPAHKS